MENINSYENENYQSSSIVVDKSFLSKLKTCYWTILLIVQLNSMILLDFLTILINKIFFGDRKKNISNQVALVTGSANGLGRAIACRLAEEKCNLAIVDVNFKAAQETAVFIEKTYNVKTKAFKVDVSDFEEIQQLKIDIESNLGTVDILVNNAGILAAISLREGKPQDIQKIVDVNLTSHFWVFLLLEIFQEFPQIPSPYLRLFVHFWMG